ncbi:uncharacterized protein LOC133213974 isoform X2 [Neopsephotus bourkii]|uniref:uncharacterized protein LOC133213974 isoform X2 n=1 Tax=Neopsephotus bourkii TaxID=309878 RepID=UPI002AA55AAA|nr:uncharacterized protein LOC133213974 isoform X2 [Neopsephotus bourkii]
MTTAKTKPPSAGIWDTTGPGPCSPSPRAPRTTQPSRPVCGVPPGRKNCQSPSKPSPLSPFQRPGRERWKQVPGEHPSMPGGAASPCLGHLLASSPEIPTSMPVTPSTQTLRRLPGLGAQPTAVAQEVAVEETASSLPISRRGRAGTFCPLLSKHGPIQIFAREQSNLVGLLAIPYLC